jgi:hypothetical protein
VRSARAGEAVGERFGGDRAAIGGVKEAVGTTRCRRWRRSRARASWR